MSKIVNTWYAAATEFSCFPYGWHKQLLYREALDVCHRGHGDASVCVSSIKVHIRIHWTCNQGVCKWFKSNYGSVLVGVRWLLAHPVLTKPCGYSEPAYDLIEHWRHCVLHTEGIFMEVFHVILTVNGNCLLKQHCLTGLFIGKGMRWMWGRNWVPI